MPVDLKIARPFCLVGADNRLYAYGIGVYPQVSDEIANLPVVQWHLMDAVVQRGEWLAQYRWTVPPVTPQIIPQFVWLRPENPLVTIDIEAGWPPVYQDSVAIRHFPRMDVPQPDSLHVATDAATGEKLYRLTQRPDVFRNQPLPRLPYATYVYPGDPSPPVTLTTTRSENAIAPRGRVDTTKSPASFSRASADREFAVLANATRNAIAAQASRHAPPPATAAPPVKSIPAGGPPTPVKPKPNLSSFYDVDPRTVPPAKPAPQAGPPPVMLRLVSDHDVYGERVRARLDRRPPQAWAA